MGYIDRPPADDRRRSQRRKSDRRDRQRRQRIEGVEEERRSGTDRRIGPDRRSESGPGSVCHTGLIRCGVWSHGVRFWLVSLMSSVSRLCTLG